MGGAGRSCLFSPREKLEMRGTLATATGYRSPPPSRSVAPVTQRSPVGASLVGARSLRDEGEARAIRPFPMPTPAPYHVPMHTQPSGANQLPTDPPDGRRRMAMGARKKPRNLPPSQRKHRFLREFKRVGTLSAGRRAARISYREMLAWLDDENFRRRLREAKLVSSEPLRNSSCTGSWNRTTAPRCGRNSAPGLTGNTADPRGPLLPPSSSPCGIESWKE